MTREVTFGPMNLHFSGEEIALGQKVLLEGTKAGEWTYKKVEFNNSNKIVLATFPSINTRVCDLQVIRLNQMASQYSNYNFVGFSMDLPAALAGHSCNGDEKVMETYSDYLTKNVAKQLGVLIEEVQLFGRGLFILDTDGSVLYKQINHVTTDQVDFEALEAKIKELA